jgi:hypothetical protein
MPNYFNNQDVNRTAGRAVENFLKYFFKGFEWTIKFIFDFLKLMTSQMLGK